MRSSSVLVLVAATVLVGLLGGCLDTVHGIGFRRGDPDAAEKVAAWNGPATEILNVLGDPATSGRASWPSSIDVSPTLFDFDGDGDREVIVQTKALEVVVYDALSGRALAVLPVSVRAGWDIERVLNRVSAGVLTPGGPPSIVVASHAAYVALWTFDEAASNETAFTFQRQWNQRMKCGGQVETSMDAAPVLADSDGDGSLEIFVVTEEAGFMMLDAAGAVVWEHCWSGGNADPVVDDLDGDGRMEAVVALDNGIVYVFDAATGDHEFQYDVKTAGITPGSISVAPTVAELDGKAPKELVFTARNAPNKDPSTWSDNHLAIIAIHAKPQAPWESEVLWLRQPDWGNPLSYTQIVAADVDGDGKTDLFGMDWNTIGHLPGDWERLGDAHVFRLDSAGNDVWVQELPAWWSNKAIAVADVDGDGDAEVVANGPSGGRDGFWRLSAATGAKEGFLALHMWSVQRGPVLADVDGDGEPEILATVESVVKSRNQSAVVVVRVDAKFTVYGKEEP